MGDAFITFVSIQPSSAVQVEKQYEHDPMGGGHMKLGIYAKKRRDTIPRRARQGGTPEIFPGPLTIEPGQGKNTLHWDDVAGHLSYNLYWRSSPGVTKSSTKVTGVEPGYEHTGLVPLKTYYYALAVVTEFGEGPLGSVYTGTTLPPPVHVYPVGTPIPLDLVFTRTQLMGGTGKFSWQNTDLRAVSFNVYWKTGPGVTKGDTKLPSVTLPFANIDWMQNETWYYFAVSGVAADGSESALSNEMSVYIPAFSSPAMITGYGLKLDPNDPASAQATKWVSMVNSAHYITLNNSLAYATISDSLKVVRLPGLSYAYPVTSLNIANPYTLLVTSRYNGLGSNARGRVISSTNYNWLIGHHGSYAGARLHAGNGWVTDGGAPNVNDWFISIATGTGSATRLYTNGVDTTVNQTGGTQPPGTLCLGGGQYPNECSNADVGEIYYWSRVLTAAEAKQATQAIGLKYGIFIL
jgi:hypothetical protein